MADPNNTAHSTCAQPTAAADEARSVKGTLLDDALALSLPPFSHGDGILYILASADGSLAKVGMTVMANPLQRAANYGREHGIAWTVFWFAETRLVGRVETDIHRALRAHQHVVPSGAREIFSIRPTAALAVAMRHILPRKAVSQLRTEAVGPILRSHDMARLEKARKGIRKAWKFNGWKPRPGHPRQPWEDDRYVRARIKVSDETRAQERAEAEAQVAAMSEADLRAADAEQELKRRREKRMADGQASAAQTRERRREELQARMADADAAEKATLEAIAALWSAQAGYWRQQVTAEQAALAAHGEQNSFRRLRGWVQGASPVRGHRTRIWAFKNQAAEADAEAVRIREIVPTAGALVPQMEAVDRMLENGRERNVLIDPIFPEGLRIPAAPPPLPVGNAS